MKHIVIIGNGVSGTTAARHIRKLSEHRVTIISDETSHFYSRTALMYIYMGHMRFEDTKPYDDSFWEKNRLELLQARVEKVDTARRVVCLAGGKTLAYDELVIATGSQSNFFGWPGQNLVGVQGLYHFQDLQLMEKNTAGIKRGVIVGGGLIGIEMAEMLLSRGIAVTILVREPAYWSNVLPMEEARLISRHVQKHHIDLRLETELGEIVDNGKGRVAAVRTKNGQTIPCEFVGLTAGVHPNIDLAKASGIATDRGVLVDRFLRTSAPQVYAIGDCIQHKEPPPGRRPLEQVWYTGKIMGEVVARTLCGHETRYEPGIWFNSAKFLDIEYQTYGVVLPTPPAAEKSFYWEDAENWSALRINYHASTRAVTGFNAFGIRLRHGVCEHWIGSGTTVESVVENLPAANFDPELFRQFEPRIVEAFNREHAASPVSLKTPKGLWSAFFRSRTAKPVTGGQTP